MMESPPSQEEICHTSSQEESEASTSATAAALVVAPWNGQDDFLFRSTGLSLHTQEFVNIFSQPVVAPVSLDDDDGTTTTTTSWQPIAIIDRKGISGKFKNQFPKKLINESEAIKQEIRYRNKNKNPKRGKKKKKEVEVEDAQQDEKENTPPPLSAEKIRRVQRQFFNSFPESSHYADLISCLQQQQNGLTVEEIASRLPALESYVLDGLETCGGYHEDAYQVEDLDGFLRHCSGFRTDIQRRKIGRGSARYVYEPGNPNAKKKKGKKKKKHVR